MRPKDCYIVCMVICLVAMLLPVLNGCGTTPPKRPVNAYKEVGMASYYAHKFQGRKTASGERYDKDALTAAHPNLPFDTIVRVVNLRNGKSVDVRINDRGPFVKGRIIDLSYAAAKQVGMIRAGVVKVSVTAAVP